MKISHVVNGWKGSMSHASETKDAKRQLLYRTWKMYEDVTSSVSWMHFTRFQTGLPKIHWPYTLMVASIESTFSLVKLQVYATAGAEEKHEFLRSMGTLATGKGSCNYHWSFMVYVWWEGSEQSFLIYFDIGGSKTWLCLCPLLLPSLWANSPKAYLTAPKAYLSQDI